MRIPKYYCPHCDKFKRPYQVDHMTRVLTCRSCGTEVINTKLAVECMIRSDYSEEE